MNDLSTTPRLLYTIRLSNTSCSIIIKSKTKLVYKLKIEPGPDFVMFFKNKECCSQIKGIKIKTASSKVYLVSVADCVLSCKPRV